MSGRILTSLENSLYLHKDWQCFKNQIYLEDVEGFEGEIIVHVFVHRSNKHLIYNGMYIGSNEPYLMLVHHVDDNDENSVFETYRNLKQDEETLKIIEYLKKHDLMDQSNNLIQLT